MDLKGPLQQDETSSERRGPNRGVGPRLLTLRELVFVALFIVIGMFAVAVFDEWRGPLQTIYRILVAGIIAFFVGRVFWRWWKARPTTIATKGAVVALLLAVVGWLDVGLAKAVTGISEGNYALIVIVPLTMMLGAFVSLAGLFAAGLGVAVTMTGLTRTVARPAWVVSMGIASVVLNLGHIVALVHIFMHP
jgi:hypothetical protein